MRVPLQDANDKRRHKSEYIEVKPGPSGHWRINASLFNGTAYMDTDRNSILELRNALTQLLETN